MTRIMYQEIIDFEVFKNTLKKLLGFDNDEKNDVWKKTPDLNEKVKSYLNESIKNICFLDMEKFLLSEKESDQQLTYRLAQFCRESQLIIWKMIKESGSSKTRYDKDYNVISSQMWFFQNSTFFKRVPHVEIIKEVLNQDINALFSTRTQDGNLIVALFYYQEDLRYLLEYKNIINQQPDCFKKDMVRFLSGLGLAVTMNKFIVVALELLFGIDKWYIYNEKATKNIFYFMGNRARKTHRKKTESLFYKCLTEDFFLYQNNENINVVERLIEQKYFPSKRIVKKCVLYQPVDIESCNLLFKFLSEEKNNPCIQNNNINELIKRLQGVDLNVYLKVRKTYEFEEMFQSHQELSKELTKHIIVTEEKKILNTVTSKNSNLFLNKKRI